MIGGRIVAETVVPAVYGPLRAACSPATAHPFVIRQSMPDRPSMTGHCEGTTASLVELTDAQLAIRLFMVFGRLVTHIPFMNDTGEPDVRTVPLIDGHIWAHHGPLGSTMPEVYLYDLTPDQAAMPAEETEEIHLPSPICGTYDDLASQGVIDVVSGRRIRLDYQPRVFLQDVPALLEHSDHFDHIPGGESYFRQRLPQFSQNLMAINPALGQLVLRQFGGYLA